MNEIHHRNKELRELGSFYLVQGLLAYRIARELLKAGETQNLLFRAMFSDEQS